MFQESIPVAEDTVRDTSPLRVRRAKRQADLVSGILHARSTGDTSQEKALAAELLASVDPVIRSVVGYALPRAGTLSPDDLKHVAVVAVLRTVAKYDPTIGRQSFGEVAFFRARAACEQYARMHGSDFHLSDGAHKGRTIRARKTDTVTIQRVDMPSHFSDGSAEDNHAVGEFEAALGSLMNHDEDSTNPELALLAAERRARVFEAVRRLPPQQRELVSRVYGFNRNAEPVAVVAESWGAPRSRVARMLARTLVELRELLAGEEE